MAERTYYCRVSKENHRFKLGTYVYTSSNTADEVNILLLRLNSDKVWKQGPKGGVKIIKDSYNGCDLYITHNEKEMKEFMWAKLRAQEIKKGA